MKKGYKADYVRPLNQSSQPLRIAKLKFIPKFGNRIHREALKTFKIWKCKTSDK